MAIAGAREERRLERERVKLAESERLMTKATEQMEAAAAEAEARNTREKILISRVIEDEAARKAERDRRYASRKARQA